MLFLSYAEEDTGIAAAVADWLSRAGQAVYPVAAGAAHPTLDGAEERISQADGYVALLSPHFLSAPLCRRERELAMSRQQDLRLRYPAMKFVHVLLVRDTNEPGDGFPPRIEWLDLSGRDGMDSVLRRLVPQLPSEEGAVGTPGRGAVFFRNRSDELDNVVRSLTNFGGPHFWLLIAPPQLGKTWFLDRLGAMLVLQQRDPWVVKLVDVRDQKAEVRTEIGPLLRCLFGPDSPTTPDRSTYVHIAQKIIARGRRQLYMIDSAELLAEDTAGTLRTCLSEIHNLVSRAGLPQARFAVVIASRREQEWRGITPEPRFSILRLTEFNLEVVEEALTRLADEMNRTFPMGVLPGHAVRVHRFSEGLPALLSRCIAWIRREGWVDMERLEESELPFMELAQPYVKDSLLARESLFPLNRSQADPNLAEVGPTLAFEHALRVLAPYRLFTQSHLRHYHVIDQDLRASMDALRWTVEDLWRVISSSALLTRPLDEPWQEIPAGIRRLLFRYYYPGHPERVLAHREARNFMAVWADQQSGKEQVIGMRECLWHEAAELRLGQSSTIEPELIGSARVLSRGLRPSGAYTEDELRVFAERRIGMDEEFRETIRDHGLVGRIIAAIKTA